MAREGGGYFPKGPEVIFLGVGLIDKYRVVTPGHAIGAKMISQGDGRVDDHVLIGDIRLNPFPIGRDANEEEALIGGKFIQPR